MIGPRQRRILDLLRDGPATLNALIHRTGDNPQLTGQSVKALAARGLVRVVDRTGKHDLGVWVELVDGPAAGANSADGHGQ